MNIKKGNITTWSSSGLDSSRITPRRRHVTCKSILDKSVKLNTIIKPWHSASIQNFELELKKIKLLMIQNEKKLFVALYKNYIRRAQWTSKRDELTTVSNNEMQFTFLPSLSFCLTICPSVGYKKKKEVHLYHNKLNTA